MVDLLELLKFIAVVRLLKGQLLVRNSTYLILMEAWQQKSHY